jgi:hypothetical protein
MQTMYYIGLDVHKRTISYCVKDGRGTIHAVHSRPSARASTGQFSCCNRSFLSLLSDQGLSHPRAFVSPSKRFKIETHDGSWHMVLRKDKAEIGNSG